MERLFDPGDVVEPPSPNPCIALYGHGPIGEVCGSCDRLICHGWTRNYYKCPLRKVTHGAATDHRVSWPACGMWRARSR